MTSTYFFIYFPLILVPTIYFSRKLNLVDVPDERKIHEYSVPHTMGVAVYLYLVLIIFLNEFSYEVELIISVGSLMILLGFIDDQINLTPGIKLLIKSIPVLILIYDNYNLVNLGYYEYLGYLNLGKFSIIFSFLACILLINSYNYIDGIDGLLIILVINTLTYFIFLNQPGDHDNFYFYQIVYCLTICLFFNLLPNTNSFKAFMGNSGSLFCGFFISFIMIYFYKFKNIHPAYLIWGSWIVVYDFLYVTFNRIYNRKDFSKPDTSHLHHHIFYYLSKNKKKTLAVILLINNLIIILGYLVSKYIGNLYSLLLFIILFKVFILARLKLSKHLKK